jgi:hypothetical protein
MDRITFDPKVGFHVNNASSLTDNKFFNCIFNLDNKSEIFWRHIEVIRESFNISDYR